MVESNGLGTSLGSGLWALISWPFRTTGYILVYIAELLRLIDINRGRSGITDRAGGRRRPRTDPRQCAERFNRVFESCYGTQHPEFRESSYTQALEDGKRDLKFLLIYLHSEEHDNADKFCRTVLTSTQLCDFVDRHQFICWAGDIEDQEAFQVSTTLEATAFPFLAIVALHMPGAMSGASVLSSSARMTVVDRLDGIMDVNIIINRLQRVVDRYEGQLEAARAERRQREINRILREEQDAAYQASLRADQEKERRARETRERKERIERELKEKTQKRLLYRQYLRAQLPDEPLATEENTTRLGIRLPDGHRITRRFRGDERIEHVFAFIDTLDIDATSLDTSLHTLPPADYKHHYNFILVSPMPRAEYTADAPETAIASISAWWPSANLLVERIEEDTDEDVSINENDALI
ncbi:thioredoxin-like protein [Syncephalis fuscata]|nr:thioredoxin-like protein [Syncephalis fuscata]